MQEASEGNQRAKTAGFSLELTTSAHIHPHLQRFFNSSIVELLTLWGKG